MLRSVKLNSVADAELKDKKVDYEDQGNIIDFAYGDWIRYIRYNVKDVLLQVGIERKTNDLTTYYMRAHSNLTPYSKIFKETHLLRNVRAMYFERDGWVQGNNLNVLGDGQTDEEKRFYGTDDDDEDTGDSEASYKGAINALPAQNDNVGMVVLGNRTNYMFANSIDYDMGAFYPSIKIASNLGPETLLYKAALDNSEFISGEFQNRSANQTYEERDKHSKIRKLDHTGEAVNTYVSGNVLTFGYNWLSLPSVSEMVKAVEEKLSD